MRFRFDSNQPFQLRAIESVADLLRGQHRNSADFVSGDLGSMFGPVRNRLDLSETQLFENLQAVQREQIAVLPFVFEGAVVGNSVTGF